MQRDDRCHLSGECHLRASSRDLRILIITTSDESIESSLCFALLCIHTTYTSIVPATDAVHPTAVTQFRVYSTTSLRLRRPPLATATSPGLDLPECYAAASERDDAVSLAFLLHAYISHCDMAGFYTIPPVIEPKLLVQFGDEHKAKDIETDWRGGSGAIPDVFLEGITSTPDGALYVVDVPFGRILRVDPDRSITECVQWDGEPNGLAVRVREFFGHF